MPGIWARLLRGEASHCLRRRPSSCFAYRAGALSGSIGTGLLHGLKLTPVATVAQALWGMFALSWLQAFQFEHGSCGRAFQEQDERLRSLGCVAVGADTRGEFRHLCELSWQWPY